MPTPASSRRSDLVAQIAALALAVTCAVFAGYKVMKLRGMENPPPDMGLNFPAPKRKIITDDSILVDSLTTGSIGPAVKESPSPHRPLQPYTSEAPLQDYRLIQVINGMAFVEVRTLRGKEVRLLTEGVHLPGAGTVTRISRRDGRWTLQAGDVTLLQDNQ